MTTDKSGVAAFIKKLLFPADITCLICGGELSSGGNICCKCLNKMPFIQNACKVCGCNVFSGNVCVRCKYSLPDFDKNYSACRYDNFVKNIIYRLKNGDKYLHKPLTDIIAENLQKLGAQFDVIITVPVTKKVKKQRGYNQSELIARRLAKKTGIPFINALEKTKETLFQKNCAAGERRKNVEKAFKVNSKEDIKGKSVLIADDIITTGSTLSECALILKKAGAKNVICCTFAAVSPQIKSDSNTN